MKFKSTIKVVAKLKKKKSYDFEFTDLELKKIKKATYKKPYMKNEGLQIITAYEEKGIIHLTYYLSSQSFEQIKEEKTNKK